MKKKRNLLLAAICICIVGAAAWMLIRSTEREINTHNGPWMPTGVLLGDETLFYEDMEIVRDEFTIQQIIGQTNTGYLAIPGGGFQPGQGDGSFVLFNACKTKEPSPCHPK